MGRKFVLINALKTVHFPYSRQGVHC